MQLFISGRLSFSASPALSRWSAIAMHLAPFAQAHLTQEIAAAIILAIGFFVLYHLQTISRFSDTRKFRFFIGEFLVCLIAAPALPSAGHAGPAPIKRQR
jgi:Gpi18-like mannosyltransferase